LKDVSMSQTMEIKGRKIGKGHSVFIIAEISANHNQKYEEAVALVTTAKECGADAVKLQTYTPDTITMKSDDQCFRIKSDTNWDGRTLYELYTEAYTPWDWQPRLKDLADELGIIFFSSAFDTTSVEFLEGIGIPAYKLASFEIVDLPLIEFISKRGKPIIISTGLASLEEIDEAVQAAKRGGCQEIALLKCTSAYPASPNEMNLRAIPFMSDRYNIPIGISDHTLGATISVAAVALGANIVEKHFTLSRAVPGPDSQFSVEPAEFQAMVNDIRKVEAALGDASFEIGESEKKNMIFRRSLFVVMDMRKGERFTEENVRSIRPNFGLQPKFLKDVLGRRAKKDVSKGTPLSWELIE